MACGPMSSASEKYIVRVHERLLPPPAFAECRPCVLGWGRAVAVMPRTSTFVWWPSVSPQEAIATAPPPASVHQYPGHSTSVPLLHSGHAPPRSYELGEKRVQLSASRVCGLSGRNVLRPQTLRAQWP